MAFAPPEHDPEEAARIEKALVRAFGGRVEQMLGLRLRPGPERSFIEEMDLKLNVLRRGPSEADIARIKSLVWKYRRQLPQYNRPKLPPDDPVVRAMEMPGG